jgi:outer membrane immunogenic protein
MKKAFVTGALIAGAMLLAGTAMAADMSAKPAPMLMKAPPMAAYTWTGCYLGAGIGYGMYNQDHQEFNLDGTPDSIGQTDGGRGWLGRGQVGCDYQFNTSIVVGAFGDYDWSNIKGDHGLSIGTFPDVGQEKLTSTWAAGGRIGWLPMERFMTFVSGGFTQARFSAYDEMRNIAGATIPILHVDGTTRHGYFIGSGYEYAIGWFPGLNWKTEYRFADFGTQSDTVTIIPTGVPSRTTQSHIYVQTITSELVWRFGAH